MYSHKVQLITKNYIYRLICAAGWGRTFTAGLTIMGSPFQAFFIG